MIHVTLQAFMSIILLSATSVSSMYSCWRAPIIILAERTVRVVV
jgi:hypothetical protein